MGRTLLFTGLIGVMTMAGSCVPKGKYTRLDARMTNYEMENRQLVGTIGSLEAKNKELQESFNKFAEAKENELKALNDELQKKTVALEEATLRVTQLEAQLQGRTDSIPAVVTGQAE